MTTNETAIITSAGDGTQQGFGTKAIERAHETASSAVAAQAKAAIEARYIVALQRPRDWDTVRSKLLKDCKRPSFAKVARYLKPIGRGVEGPSIRFVEAALRAMGNIAPESMVIYEDNEKRIVRITVTDLEDNLSYSKDVVVDKTVERSRLADGQMALGRRKNSRGRYVFLVAATDDELLAKQTALESKAIRGLGLRLIPGDLIDEAQELCMETARRSDAADPDAARKSLADGFAKIGVTPKDLAEYLGHDLAKSSPAEFDELRAVWTTIGAGEAVWADALDCKKAERGEYDKKKTEKISQSKGAQAVKERLAERAAKNVARQGQAEAAKEAGASK